jgi:hypothetical protein
VRSSWSGFQPQNEIVKLQWAVLEASQLDISAQELSRLLEITGLKRPTDSDDPLDEDGIGIVPDNSPSN